MFLTDYLLKNTLIYVGAIIFALAISWFLKNRPKENTYQKELQNIIDSKDYKVKSQWD